MLSAVLGARLKIVEVLPSPWRFDAPGTAVFGNWKAETKRWQKGGNVHPRNRWETPSQKKICEIYKSSNHLSIFFVAPMLELSLVSPQKKWREGLVCIFQCQAMHPFLKVTWLARLVASNETCKCHGNTAKCWKTPNLRILNFAAPDQISKSFSDPNFADLDQFTLIVKTLASSCTTFSRWRSFSFILGNRSLDSIDRFNASHWQIHLLF